MGLAAAESSLFTIDLWKQYLLDLHSAKEIILKFSGVQQRGVDIGAAAFSNMAMFFRHASDGSGERGWRTTI